MKRITQKMLTEFIAKVAYIKSSNIPDDNGTCYHSKVDGSYMTRVGMEKDLKFLLKYGITKQLQAQGDGTVTQIGFNPEKQKWYGWSHRAIYGFGIGSKCEKGHCGYIPATPQELFDSVTVPDDDGWAWHKPEDVELIKNGIRIKTQMAELVGSDGSSGKTSKLIADACDEIESVDGKTNYVAISSEPDYFDLKCGKGEWIAKTLEDAKQMACDFADGVS